MKKRHVLFVLAALLMLMLLPGTAGAAKSVGSGYSFSIGAGETILPDYPDLAEKIGAGLTRDDFIVTYSHIEGLDQSYLFDEQGRITISETHTVPSSFRFYMTYTPKVQGVGTKTVFSGLVYVYEPLTEIKVVTPEVVLATDETATARIYQADGTAPILHIADYDTSIIDASLAQATWNKLYWDIAITPKAVGETDIIIEAYNGMRASIHVTVTNPPSKLSFAQETFTCYVGDTIDLGMDLGGGSMNADPRVSVYQTSYYTSEEKFFPDDWSHFYARETGEYTITMTTYNGHSATVHVNAYSRENCVRLGLPYETVNVGQGYMYIYAYDAADNRIFPALSITKGSEIASIKERQLVTTGEGTVEITAANPDGSTVSMTVEVIEVPTKVFLNATELTLNIGDTFDFEVSFDKGKTDYRLDHYHDDYFPPYALFPIRREGNRIVAQAPGTARVTVYAGHLSETCYITVLDSDAEVSLVTPEEPFGVGHTAQLSVVDRTGKTYPAVFTNDEVESQPAAIVTADGLLTGVRNGTSRIYATLEDGRVLRYDQEVKLVPKWMSHPDMTTHENYTTVGLGSIETDVGLLYSTDVIVQVEDPSIATFGGIHFTFHKPGRTVVTLTAINGGAKCSFILEVLEADDKLYVPNTLLKLPSGYSMTMPVVTDYYGNVIPVTWEMTYQVAGLGNPEDYGFILKGDVLSCTWAGAMCQVTGTAENGARIRLDVHGYRLAQEIRFQFESYTVDVGENVQTEVTIVEMGYEPGPITWYVGDESIISFTEALPQTGRPTATGLKPGTTTLTAVLINGVSATCTITVNEPPSVPGDANDDGKVDVSDATLILKRGAGWAVSLNAENADVNGEGGVNIYDALLILRYCAGEDVTLQ